MTDSTDPKRNRPADEGKQGDPNIRDESAVQPGVSTLSSSDNDAVNQHLTRTASDSFREDSDGDEKA
ncbi:MAG TPA: hypothetical protein VM884_04005, partial [Flavisolibacter sp.]|nr:hypothetical protein [Flavisolibacter sp.]